MGRLPTAQEQIDRHLGGVIVDEAMMESMAQHIQAVAWMKSWTKKRMEIWYSCCRESIVQDRYSTPMRPGEVEAMLEARHRCFGRCPYCGKEVMYIRQCHTSQEDISEQYHTFYRRSRIEPETILVIGVWCGKLWRKETGWTCSVWLQDTRRWST